MRSDELMSSSLVLWYAEPATDWESQALPIGNGALGAMVFGGVARERVQFNEKTLWTGGPGSREGYDFGNWDPPRPGAVAAVRRALEERLRLDPEAVAAQLGQPRRGYGAYQPFGDVWLELDHPPGPVTGYRRELDLDAGVARVSYAAGGARFTREYFASYPGQVIVARLAADPPGALSLTARVTAPGNRSWSVTARGGRITLAGALHDNGLRFESQLQVTAGGGRLADAPDGSVTVTGAAAVTLVLAAGTAYAPTYPSYRGGDPHGRVTAAVDAAAATPYERLLQAHQDDYRALFGRVRLDLGQQVPPGAPTSELLGAYAGGAGPADRALEALLFQYGRYLLIASSRAGSLPANLQGVWNHATDPPWSADYHLNVNLQMSYWPAEVTNLPEAAEPLFDFIDLLREPGRVTARAMLGARGWVVHDETTPYGFTGVHDWPTAFWFPEAGAWLAQHLAERYRFSLDERFLRERAWPVLRELAEFWLDALATDPRDGTLVASPSYSPEHGPFSAGAAMSQQVVWDLLTSAAAAARAVGEERFGAEVEAALARLDPGLRAGSWGQLQEWKEDWDDPASTHRHASHLFALHPGRQLDPRANPELAAAARVSLAARGDGGPAWSRAWKACLWARLGDGGRAHQALAGLLRERTLPNLWTAHPPFQLDGNLGATAAIAELLLQSHTGVIDVLPALPPAWPEGSFSGLRARGDVTVAARWSGGALQEVSLLAGRTGPLTVRCSRFAGRFRLLDAASGEPVAAGEAGGQVTFTARAGRRYLATAEPPPA